MAIPIPVTRTKVATAAWGIPLTNEVNRLTTQSDAYGPRLTAVEAKTATTAWTAVTYQNGWTNFGSVYVGVGYRKIGDIVYLRGLMKDGTIGTVAFTLPAGFRPIGSLQFTVPSVTTTIAILDVQASGAVAVNVGDNRTIGANISFSTI